MQIDRKYNEDDDDVTNGMSPAEFINTPNRRNRGRAGVFSSGDDSTGTIPFSRESTRWKTAPNLYLQNFDKTVAAECGGEEEKPEGAENESVEQVAFADRLILNKCDLVPTWATRRYAIRLRRSWRFR